MAKEMERLGRKSEALEWKLRAFMGEGDRKVPLLNTIVRDSKGKAVRFHDLYQGRRALFIVTGCHDILEEMDLLVKLWTGVDTNRVAGISLVNAGDRPPPEIPFSAVYCRDLQWDSCEGVPLTCYVLDTTGKIRYCGRFDDAGIRRGIADASR